MANRNDGTTEGLLEFLDWADRTGQMNSTTARAWAVSVRQVLGIDGEDVATLDLRDFDVDDQLARFETLHRLDYSPSSMSTYKSRFRQAVSAYLSWLNNEPWKRVPRGGRGKSGPKTASDNDPVPKASEPAATPSEPVAHTVPSGTRLLNYTVPLRPDLMVTMSLPVDLTPADAHRITAFVQSLAFTPEPPTKPSVHDQHEKR